MKKSQPQSNGAPLGDPKARLDDYLENCRVPLSADEWVAFRKDLDSKHLQTTFELWIEPKRKYKLRSLKVAEKAIGDSLVLALHQVEDLRARIYALERFQSDVLKAGSTEPVLRKMVEEWRQQASKRMRDRKPDKPSVQKNWLEAMPVFNEGKPFGYIQATGQRRKVVESFLRRIKAKPIGTIPQKSRGKPKRIYGFETNCRVLEKWLGAWCEQGPEAKYDLILREALLLAEVVADAKSPPDCSQLATLRRILTTQTRPAAKQLGEDFDFDFLGSPGACAAQIELLRKKFPRPNTSSEATTDESSILDSIQKALAGEHGKPPV